MDKDGRRALSKKEYEQALKDAGFCGLERYYPYPDHKFPMAVYSDGRLPESGELNANIRNFDGDRYVIFDETKVFDSFLKEGIFPEFSNSFLYVCCMNPDAAKDRVLYTKYSNERERRFQIRTDIVRKADGSRYVRKCPLCKEAEAHVQNMQIRYERLCRENGETGIRFCPVDMAGNAAVFAFARGDSIQCILRYMLEEKRFGEAEEYLKTVIGKMRGYFEKRMPKKGALTNLDMVFSNILVEDGGWNLIDYEWTFDAEIPADFVIYRALFRASIELPKCPLTRLSSLLATAGITEEQGAQFADWEMKFQDYITGKQIPARDMVEYLGNQVKPFPANKTSLEREAERLIWNGQGEAVKICFSIDAQGSRCGRAFCSGWACAKRRGHAERENRAEGTPCKNRRRYIPVKIQIVEEDGAELECQLRRTLRPDVKTVLRAAESEYEIWGFDASWTARENVRYKIRFFAGKLQKEIELSGVKE